MNKMEDRGGLVPVWRLPDEPTGLLLKGVLAEEGIESLIRSEQVAWMDDVMKTSRGYWGSLLVFADDAARARGIISGYLEGGAGGDPEKQNDSLD